VNQQIQNASRNRATSDATSAASKNPRGRRNKVSFLSLIKHPASGDWNSCLRDSPSATPAATVIIMSPMAGGTVMGMVPANASVTANAAVKRVDLLVNGVQVVSSTTAPYAFKEGD